MSKQRQFRFAGVAGLAGPTRSHHSEANFTQWGGGGRGSWRLANPAIQSLPLHGEHALITFDDIKAAAVQVCRYGWFGVTHEVTPQ